MIIVSSAELRNNLKKYLDTAATETVVIQRGRNETFVLNKQDRFAEISTEAPDDFHRAITGKEVISAIETGFRDIIKRKNELKVVV
jgi:hypothetical protein